MKEDFTKDNIYKKIEESSLSDTEKKQLKETVDEYYNDKTPDYGNNDGLAYGEIAPMFDGTGGGYQYDMPLDMNDLYNIGMIDVVKNY